MCFFFNDTATTEIYTLSLHDALPIFSGTAPLAAADSRARSPTQRTSCAASSVKPKIGKHTSELQSHSDLVCRLLLEKKKKKINYTLQLKKKKKRIES